MTTLVEDAFHVALDADRTSSRLRRELATHLARLGDPRADGYFVIARLGLYPQFYDNMRASDGMDAFCWWKQSLPRGNEPAKLPIVWWESLVGARRDRAAVGFRNYDTRRAAEDAAAVAWSRLDERTRTLLISGAGVTTDAEDPL